MATTVPNVTGFIGLPNEGFFQLGGKGDAKVVGPMVPIGLQIPAVTAGAANTTEQASRQVGHIHRLRQCTLAFASFTAVGSDPTVDVYATAAPPRDAPTAALVSPASAGNVDNGAHDYSVAFVTAAGTTIPGPTVTVTVADKTTNGKVALSNIPIGPTGTTQRKIFRTKADAPTAAFLLTTIANNTATTYTDNTADSGISAGAPTDNTTGATILSAPIQITQAHHVYTGMLSDAAAPLTRQADVIYTARVVTGASTGALGIGDVTLLAEILPQ